MEGPFDTIAKLRGLLFQQAGDSQDFGQLVLELKGENRKVYQDLLEIKRKCQASKGVYERAELALQNALYQKKHLLGQIQATRDISHEYEKVELVPMEEFMSTQMETDIPRDEYHLMIARLEDEHGRRRQLTERLAVAKRARDVAMERVKQSRKELDLVRDQVKSILKMADSLKLSKSFLPAAVVVRQETASQPVIEESKLVGLAALNDCFQAFLRDNADLCISSSFYEQSNISNQSTSVVTFDEEEDEVEDSASIASGPVSPVKKAAHEQHPQHIHHQSSRGRESVESLPRFKHSYLEVSFQKEADSEGSLFILFYHEKTAEPDSPSPILMTVDARGLDSAEQIEQWLLGLSLEPEMLKLTSDVHQEGTLAFTWIQGINDRSLEDPLKRIEKFCKAVLAAPLPNTAADIIIEQASDK